jgi:hypothetical protein
LTKPASRGDNPPEMTAQNPVPVANEQSLGRFLPLESWTVWLQFLSGVVSLANVIAIVVILRTWYVLEQAAQGKAVGSNLQGGSAFLRTCGLLSLVAGAIAGLSFLCWLYRAYLNLHLFRAKSWISPLAAVLLVLVPVLNVIGMLLVMSNLWNASEPESTARRRSPDTGTGGIIMMWWLLGIMSLCAPVLALGLMPVRPESGDVAPAMSLSIAGCVLGIVHLGLFIWILGTIRNNQEDRYRAVSIPLKPRELQREIELPDN